MRPLVRRQRGILPSLGSLQVAKERRDRVRWALVLLCLAFLMPYTAFIPKATLAAVIITAVIFSVEHHIIKPIWNSKSED